MEDYPPDLTRFVRTLKISFSSRKYHLQELAQVIKLEEWDLGTDDAEEGGGLRRYFQDTDISGSPQVRVDDPSAPVSPAAATDPNKSQRRSAGSKLMTPLKKLFVGSKNKHSTVLPPQEQLEIKVVPHQHIQSSTPQKKLSVTNETTRSKCDSPDSRTPSGIGGGASGVGQRSPKDERAHNLLDFIRSLTKLEHLIFEWTPPCGISDDSDAINWYLPPLYRSALEASSDGSTIKSLTVNVEMGCWKQVLHPSLMFERLERFTVYCRSGWCCCAEAASVLVPFIQRHKEGLGELVVVSKECQLGGLWGEVGFVPGLRRLEVEETPRCCDPSRDEGRGGGGGNLWGFLQMHSQNLTQINWRLSDAHLSLTNRDLGVWFSKDHELIQFPHLKTLELQGLQQLPPYLFFNPLLRYLKTLRASLTTLKIHGWKLMPDPFISILETVASRLLTVLDVGLEELTSDLFVEMEVLLPKLRVLKIVYREVIASDREDSQQDSSYLLPGDVADGGDRPVSDAVSTVSGGQSRTTLAVKQFVREMEELSFKEWPVEELTLRCTRVDRQAKDPQWRARRVGRAVLNALPSVAVMNGAKRAEYLREVEDNEGLMIAEN